MTACAFNPWVRPPFLTDGFISDEWALPYVQIPEATKTALTLISASETPQEAKTCNPTRYLPRWNEVTCVWSSPAVLWKGSSVDLSAAETTRVPTSNIQENEENEIEREVSYFIHIQNCSYIGWFWIRADLFHLSPPSAQTVSNRKKWKETNFNLRCFNVDESRVAVAFSSASSKANWTDEKKQILMC